MSLLGRQTGAFQSSRVQAQLHPKEFFNPKPKPKPTPQKLQPRPQPKPDAQVPPPENPGIQIPEVTQSQIITEMQAPQVPSAPQQQLPASVDGPDGPSIEQVPVDENTAKSLPDAPIDSEAPGNSTDGAEQPVVPAENVIPVENPDTPVNANNNEKSLSDNNSAVNTKTILAIIFPIFAVCMLIVLAVVVYKRRNRSMSSQQTGIKNLNAALGNTSKKLQSWCRNHFGHNIQGRSWIKPRIQSASQRIHSWFETHVSDSGTTADPFSPLDTFGSEGGCASPVLTSSEKRITTTIKIDEMINENYKIPHAMNGEV